MVGLVLFNPEADRDPRRLVDNEMLAYCSEECRARNIRWARDRVGFNWQWEEQRPGLGQSDRRSPAGDEKLLSS
eukprot:366713-Hanusia_phi.AAC.1